MTANLGQFWTTAIIAVTVGSVFLTVIVRRDLSPAGQAALVMDGGGRLFLAAALGMGILAIAVKMLIVFILSSYPDETIRPLLAGPNRTPVSDHRLSVGAAQRLPVPIWSALPDAVPAPRDNPTTPAKVRLGERLFNDPNLSRDRSVSCASCHDLATHAGADGRPVAIGVGGAAGTRNTPTVLNAAFQARLFWDGRSTSLEKQALGPLLNPIEMAMASKAAVVERVRENPAYSGAFEVAFGQGKRATIERIAKALAAYQRSLVTRDTPYDRFMEGDATALSEAQKRGMYLFRDLGCKICHAGPNFSGASQIGPRRPFAHLRTDRLAPDQAAELDKDKGAAGAAAPFGLWRVPSLRNVALTAPYFHNGAIETLREAVTIMARAQVDAIIAEPGSPATEARLLWDPARGRFDRLEPRSVSSRDIDDLVAFLHALGSDAHAGGQGEKSRRSVPQATDRGPGST